MPVSLNKEQKELLEKFREIENEKSNPSIKKFFKKKKKFLEKLDEKKIKYTIFGIIYVLAILILGAYFYKEDNQGD